jgi:hypothetical protein
MTEPARQQIPPHTLRDQVVETVRQHWQPPQASVRGHHVAPQEVEAVARAVLDVMLTRQFRVGKLPPDEEYAILLRRASHWVQRGQPISITFGYAPMKNPLTVPYRHADWAEFFALCHLTAWHNKVCAVYPPGLRIKIIFDDSTIDMANRADPRAMKDYMNSIARLIPAMGYQSLIVKTLKQSWFAWLFHLGLYQVARRRLRAWEQDPANGPMIEQMLESARRNILLPEGLGPEEQERFLQEAAHRYRLYCEAMEISRFSKLGHSLIAMYLDGTQHHCRSLGELHLTSVSKGQVTQPWQGPGVLLDNGKGTLVPFVLTGGRRERMITEEVSGINLLPVEGFDRIQVCREPSE